MGRSELIWKSPEQRQRWLTLLFNSPLELENEAIVHVFEGDPAEVIENPVPSTG